MVPPGPDTARDAAVQIVRTLRDAGHIAYLAGGCVRDMLLGLTPQDYDVATDAPPEAVRTLFRNARFVGEAFGVVLVRLRRHEVEVATFRAEWGYEDGRRPTHVEFTDARHDALRRDFTVNGLFEDPLLPDTNPSAPGSRVIDFVGGRQDLEQRVIRAIGDPRERFSEDFLRMLRAPRFASRLGFAIEKETAAAIRAQAPNLARISRERIGQEVALMLAAPTRAQAAMLIQELGLDAATLNEQHQCVDLPTLAALSLASEDTPSNPESQISNLKSQISDPQSPVPPEQSSDSPFAAALVAWMLDRHLPAQAVQDALAIPGTSLDAPVRHFVETRSDEITTRWRDALCLSNDDRAAVQQILRLLPRALTWSELSIARRKRLLAESAWPHTLLLLRVWARRAGVGPALEVIENQMPSLLASGVAPRPWVTGDDLIALGRKPGPRFKPLLDAVYDRQLDGTFADRQAALDWLDGQR